MILLAAQGLTLAIGHRTLCRNLNVPFAAGENWAILGANGTGKTTLLHALAGLRRPEAGAVRLAGRDIAEYPHRARAQQIGVLFQDPESAFPATARETVLTGRHPHVGRWRFEDTEDIAAADAALAAVGLADFSHRHLDTLSGGERRRVEIAAVLAQDAPILLLDEPTNHLDLRHQVEILELLAARARASRRLGIFVLHDVNLAARFCTHGLLLDGDGGCVHGPLADILTRETLERLYRCPLHELRDRDRRFYFPA